MYQVVKVTASLQFQLSRIFFSTFLSFFGFDLLLNNSPSLNGALKSNYNKKNVRLRQSRNKTAAG